MSSETPARGDKAQPVTIRLLGTPEVLVAGRPVTSLGVEALQTLTVIALSDDAGLEEWRLRDNLPARGHAREVSKNTLHQRIRKLKAAGVPIPDLSPKVNRYRLDRDLVERIDTEEFVRGVAALPDPADPGELDRLMALWRDNPWASPTAVDGSPWDDVRDAHGNLVEQLTRLDDERRAQLTGLVRFARLFPGDRRLDPLRQALRTRPRLLVVEDQIMTDLRSILDAEFDVQPVHTMDEWNDVCNSLAVDGALIDRHLTADLADDRGTTVVAEFLRRYTEIPAALMSVAPPATYTGQAALRHKYRLLEVVHKGADQRLNETELLEVARLLVDEGEEARHARMTLWIESDLYHVEQERIFHSRRPRTRERAAECRQQAEKLLDGIRSMVISQAESEVLSFHERWGRGPR